MGISSMGNTNSEMNSRQGFRPAMHYSDTPQMGGLKSSMQSNLNHRLPSSHQRMESGDIQYSSIRNGGRNIVSSKRNIIANELTEKEMELQQVPIKIFEMHGFVRPPMKIEEMQGTTIYRAEMDYHGTMVINPRKTSSKRQK